jgi:hypothetical protein
VGIVIDHGRRRVAAPGEEPRERHEISTCAGDPIPRRSGYRRLGVWNSPLLGAMVRWGRDFPLAEGGAAGGFAAPSAVPLAVTGEA